MARGPWPGDGWPPFIHADALAITAGELALHTGGHLDLLETRSAPRARVALVVDHPGEVHSADSNEERVLRR